MKREYLIISDPKPMGLSSIVSSLLSEGWELVGGVCCEKGNFYQAMVRFK
jgi:hypothetical protein